MNNIPTLQQLYNSIVSDIEAEFGLLAAFGKSFLRAFSAVLSGQLKMVYYAIGKMQKNIFIDTAEPVAMGGSLERWGFAILKRYPSVATQGQYTFTVTGTNGAVIKAQQTFKSDDTAANPGKLFILDNAYTLTGTTGTIQLRALEAGINSKLNVGETVTATSPLGNVNDTAVMLAQVVEPKAAEDIEDYRAKALQAYRIEPQGGAGGDYRLWALDAQGVKQSYPYVKSGAVGVIQVYVEATIADSIDGKGTPSTSLLNDVAAVIELDPDTTLSMSERGRRPMTVKNVEVLAVDTVDIDIVITGLANNNADKQAAILAQMTEAISKVRPFIPSTDIITERNDLISQNTVIYNILTAIPGAVFTSVTLKADGVTVTNKTFDNGQIPFLNSITYV